MYMICNVTIVPQQLMAYYQFLATQNNLTTQSHYNNINLKYPRAQIPQKMSEYTNSLTKILHDKNLQQQWQKKYKTENISSSDSDPELDIKQINKQVSAVRSTITKIVQDKERKSGGKTGDSSMNTIQQKLKNKIAQLTEVNNYASHLTTQNLLYKKQRTELTSALKQMYHLARSNFTTIFQDSWFVPVENLKDNALMVTKQLTKVLYKLAEYDTSANMRLMAELEKANMERNNVNKINQRLVGYIEQRKAYTDGLKQVIVKLRAQIKLLQQQNNKKQAIPLASSSSTSTSSSTEINIDKIQQKLDIKYMNRNDLITIVKIMMQKIRKHQKQCPCKANRIHLEELERFSPRDLASAIKRSSSRGGSREKEGSRQKTTKC